MTEPTTLECWDHFSTQPAPTIFDQVLRDHEALLWVAQVSSVRTASRHVREGAITLIAAVFFLSIAPWNQTIDEYCASNSSGRCEVLAYLLWPALAFLTLSAVWNVYSAWRSKYRPWTIYLGLSDKRAMFMDKDRPNTFRYVYLRLHPAKLGRWNIVAFEGQQLAFFGLSTEAATRALHFAGPNREKPRILAE